MDSRRGPGGSVSSCGPGGPALRRSTNDQSLGVLTGAIGFTSSSQRAVSALSGSGRTVMTGSESRDRTGQEQEGEVVRRHRQQARARAVIPRKEVKGMKIRLRHTLAGVGLAAVLVGGGAAVASAATSDSSPATTTPTSSTSAPTESPPRSTAHPGGVPKNAPPGGSSKDPPSGGSSHCTHMGNRSSTGS
jgi:hypothetical protein